MNGNNWRNTFYGGSLIFLALFAYLVLAGKDGQLLFIIAAFIALIAARFDDIAKFKLSKDGVEGEMRQVLDEARATLAQLHSVAETQSKMILWSMQAHGRWGGLDFDSQNAMREAVVANLRALHVAQSKIDDVLAIEHPYVDFDHVFYVKDAVDQMSFTPETLQAWNEHSHAHSGIGSQPTPDELEQALRNWNLVNPDILERLSDYRFYLANRTHRRPQAWKAFKDR